MDLNRVQILGRLTQDPELRQTQSGQNVVSFSVATNRVWKDTNGEMREQAEFHNCVAWGGLAETIGKYLKKGKRVYLEGRLQTRSWEDSNGQKRWKTEVVIDKMIMLDSKSSSAGGDIEHKVPEMDVVPEKDISDMEPPISSDKDDENISVEDVPF